jgi:hypothetical protein
MTNLDQAEPQFPLRIIYDDGQLEVVDSADDLLRQVDSIDTIDDRGHVWVRDDLGRTVRIRMVGGELEHFEAVEA